jgi:leucyl aminopeptidase
MTKIITKDKIATPEHVFILTTDFKNTFAWPEKVENYFHTRLKSAREKAKKGNLLLQYNYIGTSITIVVLEQASSSNKVKEEVRRHAAGAADAANLLKGKSICIYNQGCDAALALAAAEGMCLANYQFLQHKPSAKSSVNTLSEIVIVGKEVRANDVKELQIVCDAVVKARDLVNEPVNFLNAEDLSKAFQKMGKESGFKVQVLGKKEIQKLKMGGLLAVNAGSVDAPTFSVMEYKPSGAKNKKPIVLVGKGVVYDTGGLSLKPTPNSMDSMKCDMAGAAAVGSAMYAIAKAGLKVHVVGLVPATDNRPGFNAFAPGDIITMMDGSTVEMLNSDAEGRMILADALHYAKRYEPELVVDIATLTGAAVAAIGTSAIVGMGTAEGKHKEQLIRSAFSVHERIAEMPFCDDYDDMIKSDIADQKNLGGPYAGSITAGRFLLKYTNYPYYHLDIAGPAFLSTKDSYRGKGGTGCGVRLFFEFVKSMH